MAYWLMKSEPDVYSIDDLERDGREPWDGIRNYQARNFMRDEMKVGDKAFFYHSNADTVGIVGTMTIASTPYDDPTQFDKKSKYFDAKSSKDKPRWQLVDVAFESKFSRVVTLAELKANSKLADMRLVQKGNRLSIMPVAKKEWDLILKMV
ncbi:MAG: EVE domain-containing protein [Pseudomonadota bacterium]